MKMHLIDWSIIVFLLGSLLVITIYARKYMHSVADFMAANCSVLSRNFRGIIKADISKRKRYDER